MREKKLNYGEDKDVSNPSRETAVASQGSAEICFTQKAPGLGFGQI